jgi:chromosome partitioning protein
VIVSFLGLKGGQGKSSLAVRLGAWLTVVGHRVLVVDLSPAATASQLLGHGLVPDAGSGELLGGEADASRAVRETACPRLSLVPADAALEGFPPASEAVARLRAAARAFDFTLVDAPTGWDGAALVALAAGAWAIVPTRPDVLGTAGARRTLEWMRDSRSRFRRRAALAGVLVNAHEPRSRAETAVVRDLARELSQEILKTTVRRDPRWREPDRLAACWERPGRPAGADRDVVELRRELLGLLVRRG